MPAMRKQTKTRHRLADQRYAMLLREDAEEMTKELLELVMSGPSDLPAKAEEPSVEGLEDVVTEYENWTGELKKVAEALVLKRLLIAAGG